MAFCLGTVWWEFLCVRSLRELTAGPQTPQGCGVGWDVVASASEITDPQVVRYLRSSLSFLGHQGNGGHRCSPALVKRGGGGPRALKGSKLLIGENTRRNTRVVLCPSRQRCWIYACIWEESHHWRGFSSLTMYPQLPRFHSPLLLNC